VYRFCGSGSWFWKFCVNIYVAAALEMHGTLVMVLEGTGCHDSTGLSFHDVVTFASLHAASSLLSVTTMVTLPPITLQAPRNRTDRSQKIAAATSIAITTLAFLLIPERALLVMFYTIPAPWRISSTLLQQIS